MSIRFLPPSGVAILLSTGAALADVPRVATDIAPVHALVAQVMGTLGEPVLIVPRNASPHGYAMRPSDARQLQEADAIFWIGPELEPWLEEAAATLAADAVTVALLDAPGSRTLPARTGATFAPHDDAHGEGSAGNPAHHDHDHDGLDPHAWLDPVNGKAWLDAIADTLGRLDPENAETYAANAARGKSGIDAAIARAEDLLAPVPDRGFLVFHDAYQYFEDRFDLSAAGAIALSDAADPSPARIEEVRATMRAQQIRCVLSEPQFNQGLVRTVAEGTGAETGQIDSLGSEIPLGPDFYPRLIVRTAEVIAQCAN